MMRALCKTGAMASCINKKVLPMKPQFPHTQPFDELPSTIPLYVHENALLPGGQLPLEIADERELKLFFHALRSGQTIGIIQPQENAKQYLYPVGCAGRIRQYRERKDGRINVMLTGVCRFRIAEDLSADYDFAMIRADWRGFEVDYVTPQVDAEASRVFMANLQAYFQSQKMQADWETLNKAHIEEVINNLILVINFSIAEKQQLLEAGTVEDRMHLFNQMLLEKTTPVWRSGTQSEVLN